MQHAALSWAAISGFQPASVAWISDPRRSGYGNETLAHRQKEKRFLSPTLLHFLTSCKTQILTLLLQHHPLSLCSPTHQQVSTDMPQMDICNQDLRPLLLKVWSQNQHLLGMQPQAPHPPAESESAFKKIARGFVCTGKFRKC